jgi:hypothetical protein
MKLNLNRVTAICIDGREISDLLLERYKTILEFMTSSVDFGSIKFIGTRNPSVAGVEFKEIPKMGIIDYSKFCLFKLSDQVETDFCLLFQDDGFVLNPNLWNDLFYNYDYIGSPWPLYMGWPKEGEQVGNGGFSLRSKKLLELTKTFTEHWTQNEDTYIVADKKASLLDAGLKIAPIEIARLFSVENPIDENHNINTCFGYHSKMNMEEAIKKITHYE